MIQLLFLLIRLGLRQTSITACLCCFLALIAGASSSASQNRFLLLQQTDDAAQKGFSLRLEDRTDGGAVCTLSALKLVVALGDGKQWHYLVSPTGGWQPGRDYHARAVVGAQGSQLFLDGAQVASDGSASFAPASQPADAGVQQSWASDPADYVVSLESIRVTKNGAPAISGSFPARTLPQLLLGSAIGTEYHTLALAAGAPFTVEATFRLLQRPTDPAALGPIFDATGQAIADSWPGQSRTDADFERDKAVEQRRLAAWSAQPGSAYDAYGGWRGAGWHAAPSRAFHVAKHDGKWWLITPDGNPCFYKGLDTAPSPTWERTPVTGREPLFAALPPRDGPAAVAWGGNSWGSDPGVDSVAFCSVNLLHKYGPDWQTKFTGVTRQRLRAWGFSGTGKWSEPVPGVCTWPVLRHDGVPNLAGHPDPFDPAVQAALRDSLAKQITPQINDKTVVAWSVDNEYDDIITPQEIKTILGMAVSVPAKRAMLDQILSAKYGGSLPGLAAAWGISPAPADRGALYAAAAPSVPDADVEALREFYARSYYALLYKTVKSIDPDHLYAGFWIVPGWWINDSDWASIAANCDVIGYDHYSFRFTDAKLAEDMRESNKPVFCGEFSFPPSYGGERGFGLYDQAWSKDDADAGAWYAKTIRAAAANPYCVGVGWFQYRDEPQSGRGPGHGANLIYGEDYAFGAVTIADQPKWDLITAMRAANLAADKLRNQPR